MKKPEVEIFEKPAPPPPQPPPPKPKPKDPSPPPKKEEPKLATYVEELQVVYWELNKYCLVLYKTIFFNL